MNRAFSPLLAPSPPEPPVRLSVGRIVRDALPQLLAEGVLSVEPLRALRAMAACKTGELGGRVEVCRDCGVVTTLRYSCRNRHCPSCQARAQFEWVEARMERVLDVPHFHLVFTLPSELRPLARAYPRVVYAALMEVAGETVLAFAKDEAHLGALPSVTSVLHTWTRTLDYHPHVHLLVSGGGLDLQSGAWKQAKRKYLFPVKALSKRMRGAMRARLQSAEARGELDLGRPGTPAAALVRRGLYEAKWLTYAKAPFGSARAVFEYLGKYTHRVGISNRRLDAYDGARVTFATKHGAHQTLHAGEFVRRLASHVLPKGFHKIRHLGLASSARYRTGVLQRATQAVAAARPDGGPMALPSAAPAPAASPTHAAAGAAPPCRSCGATCAPSVLAEWFKGEQPRWPPNLQDTS